jgi:phosphomannomutase
VYAARNENALLAGEGSGGVAHLPLARGFDGFLTMGLILEAMARSGKRISELRGRLPDFHMEKGVIPASSDRVYYALEEVRRLYEKEQVDLTDGVRVTWPGTWLHVRASNTEPVLRVIAEGEDMEKVQRLFSGTIHRVNAVVHGRS